GIEGLPGLPQEGRRPQGGAGGHSLEPGELDRVLDQEIGHQPMSFTTWDAVRVSGRGLVNRRTFLRSATAAGAALTLRERISPAERERRKQGKACIRLWMAGGPSQFETFDPKPGAETQGPTRAIATSAPGISIAEHWTRTAEVMKEFAVIRSMTSHEGNH